MILCVMRHVMKLSFILLFAVNFLAAHKFGHSIERSIRLDLLQSSNTPESSGCTRRIASQNIDFQVCLNNGEFPAGFSVFWNVNEADRTLEMMYEVADLNRWAALGFSSSTGDFPMVGSNVVFGCSNFATDFASADYFLGQKSPIRVVNDKNLQLSRWVQDISGGICRVMFTRPFAPPTLDMAQHIVLGKPITVVVARGSNKDLGFHGATTSERSFRTVDFSSGALSGPGQDPRVIHGYLMAFGWGIIIGTGIFSAHHKWIFDGRQVFGLDIWFHLHRGLNSTGLLLMTIGFIFILAKLESYNNQRHLVIGCLVYSLGWIQPIIAYFRPHAAPKGQPLPTRRRYWNWLHWWIGRTAYILALVNINFGLKAIGASQRAFDLYYAWIGVVGGVYVLLDIFKYFRKPNPGETRKHRQIEMEDNRASSVAVRS
eukprot:186141_1